MSNKDLTMVSQYKMVKHRTEVVSLEVFVLLCAGTEKGSVDTASCSQ